MQEFLKCRTQNCGITSHNDGIISFMASQAITCYTTLAITTLAMPFGLAQELITN